MVAGDDVWKKAIGCLITYIHYARFKCVFGILMNRALNCVLSFERLERVQGHAAKEGCGVASKIACTIRANIRTISHIEMKSMLFSRGLLSVSRSLCR